jgi:hypothetical protein
VLDSRTIAGGLSQLDYLFDDFEYVERDASVVSYILALDDTILGREHTCLEARKLKRYSRHSSIGGKHNSAISVSQIP